MAIRYQNPTRILRYASDIHLEMKNQIENNERLKPYYNFERKDNHRYFLAIVGDIGSVIYDTLEKFLELVSKVHERVFYILGNHEYYNHRRTLENFFTIPQILTETRRICSKFPNVHVLENEVFEIDEYKILGCSLWSNIKNEFQKGIEMGLNDYNFIAIEDASAKYGKRLIKATDTHNLHLQSMEFLKREIQHNITSNNNRPIIILTHHAPLFNDTQLGNYTADPKYSNRNDPINSAFHTDLSEFIQLCQPNLKYWIFGHTHWSCKFYQNQTLILSNQLGYESHNEGGDFDPYSYIVL